MRYRGFMGQQHHRETSLNTHSPQGVWDVVGTVKNKEIAPTILQHTVIFSFAPAWLVVFFKHISVYRCNWIYWA